MNHISQLFNVLSQSDKKEVLMNEVGDIKKQAFYTLQKAYGLLRHFGKIPFSEEGKQFLQLVTEMAHVVQRALVGDVPSIVNFEEKQLFIKDELFILESMIADSYAEIYEYFAVVKPDYGIEFCESGIKALKVKEARAGGSFVKGSQEDIQMENYKIMLKRFQNDKERGLVPSYNPRMFAQFA